MNEWMKQINEYLCAQPCANVWEIHICKGVPVPLLEEAIAPMFLPRLVFIDISFTC